MSDSSDDAPVLDSCGCCDGLSADTPAVIDNAPGLPAIRYRPGTHAAFKSTMLARLVAAELEPDPLLGAVANPAPPPDVRAGDDFSAALIDAFAMVADVLTFYSERIANESYLRTATERRSVLELARTIGYELEPGVAASAALKLILEEPLLVQSSAAAATLPLPPPVTEAPIAAGTKVQSIPGPNEKPQTFETIEEIVARPEWNDIRPRLIEPNVNPQTTLYAEGEVAAKAGDIIVIDVSVNTAAKRFAATVTAVAYVEETGRTRIDFQPHVAIPAASTLPSAPPQLTLEQFVSGSYSLDDPVVQKSLVRGTWDAANLRMIAQLQEWRIDDVERTMRERARLEDLHAGCAVYTLGIHASVFGHNQPGAWVIQKINGVDTPVLVNPADGAVTPSDLKLDAVYRDIAAGSIAVLWRPPDSSNLRTGVYTVTEVEEVTALSTAANAKVTSLKLALFSPPAPASYTVRTTTVLAQHTRFDAPYKPTSPTIGDATVTLSGVFIRMAVGQKVSVTGARADAPKITVSEVRTLAEVVIGEAYTKVTFTQALAYRYIAATVTISANIAAATHGETVEEILGDGDSGIAYQSFALRQQPLTYVPDPGSPGGARSTLEIRVDDILWSEVPSLFGHGPRERVYAARRNDDGTTRIQFGDGITGARVPTGLANVRARYRKGIGLEGLVDAGAITLLVSRPLGLKAVTNPLPSSDAADPEPRDEARTNAPLTVLTLGRVVSLRDYQDYARGYAGVAKALATPMRGRERRGVFVTVAGPEGRAIAGTAAIETALNTFGDPHVPVRVRPSVAVYFRIFGSATIDAERDLAVVTAAVEAALRDAFSFEQRSFGQPVHRSEVTALIQNVPGVRSVNITKLQRGDGVIASPLLAALPYGEISKVEKGAELLLLDARPLDVQVKR